MMRVLHHEARASRLNFDSGCGKVRVAPAERANARPELDIDPLVPEATPDDANYPEDDSLVNPLADRRAGMRTCAPAPHSR